MAAGWQWRTQNEILGPREFGGVFETPNHPQVGVSWYEAVAFCHWFSAQINGIVRLPSEAEWERAARHTDGRIYPWGNEFDAANANTAESYLDQTTPVHLYPDGVTPEGVWDLSGNVWEWTNDVAKEGWIWVKGGAYYRGSDGVTSSARLRNNPYLRSDYLGFRCVVVPISRS